VFFEVCTVRPFVYIGFSKILWVLRLFQRRLIIYCSVILFLYMLNIWVFGNFWDILVLTYWGQRQVLCFKNYFLPCFSFFSTSPCVVCVHTRFVLFFVKFLCYNYLLILPVLFYIASRKPKTEPGVLHHVYHNVPDRCNNILICNNICMLSLFSKNCTNIFVLNQQELFL